MARRLAEALGLDASAVDGDAPLGVLCGALAEDATVPTCLLLDDSHDVPPDSPGGQLLRELLARAPGNAHFVVASRGRVAGLARRRAQRDVVEVDEAAMRFTESEVERAARSGSVDVRTATSELGGWPALIGLAMSFGTEAAREFAREEVLDALDRRRQRALAALATIGGGDRELCAAVVESVVGPTPTLDDVIAGLPLVMVDDATIEPHSLWKSLLADVLDEDARRAVCALAAAHCLAHGDTARGFDLSVAIDDVDGTRAAIRDACSRGYAALPRDLLADWLDRLPAPLRTEPEGLAARRHLGSRTRSVRCRDARSARPGAARGSPSEATSRPRSRRARSTSSCSEPRGELGPIGAVLERGFALEAEGHTVARGACQLARGFIADVIGNDTAALDELARIDPGAISPEWQVVADFLMMMTAYTARASPTRCWLPRSVAQAVPARATRHAS